MMATRLDRERQPRWTGRKGWERSGQSISRARGVRGSQPRSTQQRSGRSSPTTPPRRAPNASLFPEAAAPGSSAECGPLLAGKKGSSPRAQGCRRPGSSRRRRPTRGRAAADRSPSPGPAARGPRRPPRPAGVLRPPAPPRAGAVTSNEAAAQETKSPSPPRRRLARLLPDKKVMGRRRLGGPPWVVRPDSPERLADLYSQNFTRLARSDSEGVGSSFSRAIAAPAPLLPSKAGPDEPSSPSAH